MKAADCATAERQRRLSDGAEAQALAATPLLSQCETVQSATRLQAVAARTRATVLRAMVTRNVAGSPVGFGEIGEVEVLLNICRFLEPKDLGRLACVSASFGLCKADWQRSAGTAQLSVVEDAAHRWVLARPAVDQALVAHIPSWLQRMDAMVRPVFSRLGPGIELLQSGAIVTRADGSGSRIAASAVKMRHGRHFATFTLLQGSFMYFGVIRPGYDVSEIGATQDTLHCISRTLSAAVGAAGHCFYCTNNGICFPGSKCWEGMEPAWEGDTIGLLLDLDNGTLTVFRNGEQMGVMATGLSGDYCWAVSLWNPGDSTRIEPAPAPALVEDSNGDYNGEHE